MGNKPLNISREEYFVWAGKIMHAASMADVIMFSAFIMMSQTQLDVARAIYFSLDAISAKEKITRKVAHAIKCTKDEMRCVDEIIKQAKKANEQRNEFSHALLADDTDAGILKRVRLKITDWKDVFHPLTKDYLALKLSLAETAMNTAVEQMMLLAQMLAARIRARNTEGAAPSQAAAHHQNDQAQPPAKPDQNPEEQSPES